MVGFTCGKGGGSNKGYFHGWFCNGNSIWWLSHPIDPIQGNMLYINPRNAEIEIETNLDWSSLGGAVAKRSHQLYLNGLQSPTRSTEITAA